MGVRGVRKGNFLKKVSLDPSKTFKKKDKRLVEGSFAYTQHPVYRPCGAPAPQLYPFIKVS